jgi:hypothetical protein
MMNYQHYNGRQNMQIVNKIAFLVHEPTMYAHYSSVWAEMKRTNFVIILLYKFNDQCNQQVLGAKKFVDQLNQLGYEFYYFDDLLRDNIKFQYVVSNHKIGGRSARPASLIVKLLQKTNNLIKHIINFVTKVSNGSTKYRILLSDRVQYFPLQVGLCQIRFMYGADIGDGWSLKDWNEIYDLFLCHGPNDEAQLRKRFRGKTAVMGYPRYDRFFSPDLDVSNIIKEFGINPSKMTILWMSTLGKDASSIPCFAKVIAKLASEYNIIARPHPIAFREEPENIELLRSLSFNIDDDATRDMNELFKVADVILCDYGGSAFGAIYLEKRLILLDVPGSEDQYTVVNSSNLELREYFPSIALSDADRLQLLIKDEGFWKAQQGSMREISDKYFADNRGNSSKMAVQILSDIESIIGV